jgi:hypothetical protein
MNRVKNLTYQPIRIMVDKTEFILPPRKTIDFEILNKVFYRLERKGLIKIYSER